MTHGRVVGAIRRSKERTPENYCPLCLYRVRDAQGNYIGPCPAHGDKRSALAAAKADGGE